MFDNCLLDFRGFQVSQDLAAAARTIEKVESFHLFACSDLFQGNTEEFVACWLSMVDSRISLFPDGVLRARDELIDCARRAQTFSPALFQSAMALLLVDVLQNGEGSALEKLYPACCRNLGVMPSPVRAALMQGFRLAYDLGYLQIAPLPEEVDMTTRDIDSVRRGLVETIHAMTPEEMWAVANADYGIDVERHLNALRQVVASPDGRLPESNPVYPGDVVQWTANNPRAIGFLPCISLLCLEALAKGDRNGELAFLWSQLGQEIVGDGRARFRPVLNAFRHLCESDPDWNPYPSWNDLLIRGQAVAIPWRSSEKLGATCSEYNRPI